MTAVDKVPTLSSIFMMISALISIGLPIGLFIFFKKKLRISAVPMIVGATSFVIAVFFLESIMHALVLKPDATGVIALRSKPFLYMLYGGFAAGIFEESARYICFLFLRRKYKGVGTGVSYGIGHGGIEAILIVGLTMISNLLLVLISSSSVESASQAQISEILSTLSNTDSYLFLVSGFERVIAITVQIALSVIVWYSVSKKGLWFLYPTAIVLHAVVDFPAALLQTGFIKSFMLVEILSLLMTIAITFIAVTIHSKFKNDTDVQSLLQNGSI